MQGNAREVPDPKVSPHEAYALLRKAGYERNSVQEYLGNRYEIWVKCDDFPMYVALCESHNNWSEAYATIQEAQQCLHRVCASLH